LLSPSNEPEDRSFSVLQFNYLFTNAMELTLELSCCKYSNRDRLLPEWDINIRSLVTYVEQAHRGIKGKVYDASNKPLK
jgi:carboxypeptidase D